MAGSSPVPGSLTAGLTRPLKHFVPRPDEVGATPPLGGLVSAANRRIAATAILACLLLVLAMTVVHRSRERADGGSAPITLPETLGGFTRVPPEQDFGLNSDWAPNFRRAVGSAAFAGRAYGPGRTGAGPRLSVIAARTDLTDVGDERLGAEPHIQVGDVTCTQTFDYARGLGHDSNPVFDARKVLCWRNSRTLSVTLLALLAPDGYVRQTAAATAEAWQAVS